jgi:hypothetical protein
LKIDCEAFFRNRVESALIVTSWHESLKNELGIAGVSQVWCEQPAWYFWINQAAGVYLLEMEGSEKRLLGKEDILAASFRIKCYPYPEHPLFARFAGEEQDLVKSQAFDETNSPAFEAQEKIPAELFSVARCSIAVDDAHRFVSFAFESFDRLLTIRSSRSDQIQRDVPGIAIGYPLFDALLCMFVHSEKMAPLRVRMYCSPGLEYVKKRHRAWWRPSSAAAAFHLAVDCASAGSRGSLIADDIPDVYDTAEAAILYDRAFPEGSYHPGEAEQAIPVRLNPKWWELTRSTYACHLASACGCH